MGVEQLDGSGQRSGRPPRVVVGERHVGRARPPYHDVAGRGPDVVVERHDLVVERHDVDLGKGGSNSIDRAVL
jgi:hypothetical protein